MAEAVVAHLGDPRNPQRNLIDEGPRFDSWACVHTEPPTMVFVPHDGDTVRVRIYDDGQDPHDVGGLEPTDTISSQLRRVEDKGRLRSPISEESIVFYAQGAIDSYHKNKQERQ